MLVFFDDILVYSKTWEEHLLHLDHVLSILQKQKSYAKQTKCVFGMTEILYFDHIINDEKVRVDEQKIETIQDWPVPTTLTQLRGFLGLCNYYRRFIRGFSHLAAPLTQLTKKDAFV